MFTGLISADKYKRRCLEEKTKELDQKTKTEKTTCILTLIGVLVQTDTASRRRGTVEHEKFHFYLPFVSHVCRTAFAHCLGVRPLTVQRYKRRVREGNIATKEHGNKLNKNIDAVWLVRWFKEFASEVGEVVPVRARLQKTKDGVVTKYYSREDYTLLHLPSPGTFSTMRCTSTLLKVYASMSPPVKRLGSFCPSTALRSRSGPHSQTSAICVTYTRHVCATEQLQRKLKSWVNTRRMRREYTKDKGGVHKERDISKGLAVIVMDFSQNLTVSSVTSTPSQWYFCSLLAVNVFGIFYENEGTQTNYVYDEFASGKGSDQINSMIQHFIRTVLLPAGKKRLIVYVDNCSGQNKNNHVIKFLQAQVHMGVFERVEYKFFVKSIQKLFHIRKHVARQDCWILDDIIFAANDSATTNSTMHISRGNTFFKSYKPLVAELYKTLVGVHLYHIYTAVQDQPGVVLCRKGPDNEPAVQDLRRKVDGRLTEPEKVTRMFTHFLENLSPPPCNTEKMLELHSKIGPYVPEEHQENWIYAAPS
ncbi:hypothetical protein P3T76_006111 [Phytophthora citrophthora]|uniref:DUF7869 domain-containing protein n=1 Tax=Phytophthora citrophthora TaxID=4793 RepID=A0AAD9GQ21_9STRA|nr:hypothetical protein P3T76_006111 [Phytophthora citrophthora]